MTRTQLTALCRSIERQHIVEVAIHSGARVCGIPERVRIDLTDDRVFGEVVIRSSGGSLRRGQIYGYRGGSVPAVVG